MTAELQSLSPRDARDEFLDRQTVDVAASTVKSYRLRLRHWVRWCDEEDVDDLRDLTGRDLHRYDSYRRGEVAAATLKGELFTLKKFLDFCARIDAVPMDLPDKVDPPTLTKQEEVSEEILRADRALSILEHFREHEFGTRRHALLELVWNTGARAGAIAGLDVGDYHSDEQYVEFRHQPSQDTPLKNQFEGERPVSLSERVCNVLDEFLHSDDRYAQRDPYGRRPLFTTMQGRPRPGTVRDWMYRLTRPCEIRECPHGRDPEDCEATDHGHASKCPTSRSPHPVRSGSISWQLACGIPLELVEARVDASREVILRHYDLRHERQKMEQRRNHIVPNLDYATPQA